ncbi:hypothetical protein ACLESO_47480, partial [Pyxidicoccus sp. 3LG]
ADGGPAGRTQIGTPAPAAQPTAAQQDVPQTAPTPSAPSQPESAPLLARGGTPPSQPGETSTTPQGSASEPPAEHGGSSREAKTPESRPPTEAARKRTMTARPPAQIGSPAGIPEAALVDLSAAEKALERGDTDDALHLARRSQRVQVTGTSFSILTRAHCRQRDLSNALTAWERVPSWERVRVRRYCKQYDIAL